MLRIVEDIILSLMWKAFWESHDKKDYPCAPEMESLAKTLSSGKKCPEDFEKACTMVKLLRDEFVKFQKECEEKSEVCQFFGVWLRVVQIIKHAVASDREGNFDLYVATVQDLISLFAEFDCLNYIRYGAYYCEKIKTLDAHSPLVVSSFQEGSMGSAGESWHIQSSWG